MSQLNKIVTNFPMSLTDEENRNLALTLSAVLEGGGGGGVANAIWKPAVDQDGLMTWSWDTFPDSARPPESVNIKGPRGESGAPGRDGTNGTNGTNGENGKTPQIQINSSNAHWEWRYSGASEWTDLGVVASGAVGPQGDPGQKGADGTSVRLVGTETVAGGTQVTLGWGTSDTSAFLIPSGAAGTNGQDGFSPTVTTTVIGPTSEHPQGGTSVTITDKTGPNQFNVWNGINGQGATVNLLEGQGIQITENGTNYTIGVSADYALKSELPDVTDMATKTWVSGQGYLTAVPDSYATKSYANEASANALSQAESWVETQGYLKSVSVAANGSLTGSGTTNSPLALKTSAEQALADVANKIDPEDLKADHGISGAWNSGDYNFGLWNDYEQAIQTVSARVMIPDSADVDLKNKYLVLRTKADGTVDGWTDFQNQSYSKSEADGRYMRKETDSTLDGVGTSADKLRISDTVMDEIEAKSTITSAAGNVFTVSGGAGTEPNKNFVYSGVNYKTNLSEPTYAPQRLAVVTGDGEIISHYNDYTEGVYGTLFFVTSAHV